ncbi:hypothetical protein [Streptomyces zingiberis]|uniref:hypothetical protein n=1 Tax=Streptomyces zingiberis TaxID=2053010 RepID=UPI0019D2985D|nr:hypothetical protein [Streptomyces zingiberis]
MTDPHWTLRRLNAPSRLWGANGVAFGPDGRLWVAQYLAGMISAVDPVTGDVEPVVPPGGPLSSPDDLAFGADGSLYVADLVPGLVWRRDPAGAWRVVEDGVVAVNGITCLGDRLFVNEMRPGGRLLELFPDGRKPVELAADLALGNAMQRGPDGHLYYPHMMTGQVWRVPPDGGTPELVADGLPQPVAVRFDLAGEMHVLSCGPRGLVTRIDLHGSGRRRVQDTGVPGLDNAAFDTENRMYVSGFADSGVVELLPDGRVREIVTPGLAGPYGVTVDLGGQVHTADHYRITRPAGDGDRPGPPVTERRVHFAHGIAADPAGPVHITSQFGTVTTHDPAEEQDRVLASGLDQPNGIAVRADGTLVIAESGAGRIVTLAPRPGPAAAREEDPDTPPEPGSGSGPGPEPLLTGLGRPVDVAFDDAGHLYVTDEERGTLLRLHGGVPGEPVVVATGLDAPQGVAVAGGEVFTVETGRRRLLGVDPDTVERRVIAGELPLGPFPAGGGPAAHLFAGPMPGVPRRFAGLASAPDGALLLSAHGEGTVWRLAPLSPTTPHTARTAGTPDRPAHPSGEARPGPRHPQEEAPA